MTRNDPHSLSEAQRREDETAGTRQEQAKSARQAELLRELGEDAQPTDRAGVFSIRGEDKTSLPTGWTVAGHVPGPQGMRLLVRKAGTINTAGISAE